MDNDFPEQRILIVDDEPANISILIENLKEKYILTGATNGTDAIKCALSNPHPDLILLDIIMPDMDGYEVCKRLKAEERTRYIPLIFITVMGEDINETLGFELGAVDYIAKPFNPAIVNARIRTHLELKRHRDRLERSLYEHSVRLSDSDRRLRKESSERILVEKDRERLTTAIEQAAEAFIITDPEGVIQYVNPVFQEHTGYSPQEAAGQNISILESGEHENSFYSNVWEMVREGKTWRGTFSNKRKNGLLFKAEWAISPVFGAHGKVVNFVSVFRDVTKELELENQLRQAQKLEAIGTLAGGISHDFNNIICAILGYSELAMSCVPPDSEVFQYLGRVEKAGRRAADLIRQILGFSRRSDYERQPLQIQSVVREALKLLRGTLPSTIRISHHIDNKCRAVLASPTQIHQTVMNLCTNAYHAMRENGGILNIDLRETDEIGDQWSVTEGPPSGDSHDKAESYLCLSVRDTGHGMEEVTLSKIFDPYFTTKKISEGTGLGLSTVYGIVREHGGTITVSSRPGSGSTFRIYFPVHSGDKPSPGTEKRKDVFSKGSGRILVVDDEEPIARMIEIKLKRLGYDVAAYTESTLALEIFRGASEDFDLVVTDMTMPNMTGTRLAREVLQIRPDIPVVLCTGFTEIITEEEAKAAGIRKYLEKPFVNRKLEKTVLEILRNNA